MRSMTSMVTASALALALVACESGGSGLDARFGSRHVGVRVAGGTVTEVAVCELTCNNDTVVVTIADGEPSGSTSASGLSVTLTTTGASVDVSGGVTAGDESLSGDWTLSGDDCPSDPSGAFTALRFPDDAPEDAPLCGQELVSGCALPPSGVSISVTTSGAPHHWAPEGCIPYELKASTDAQRADIRAAFTAYEALSCSDVCFEETMDWVDDDPAPKAGHIVVWVMGSSDWNAQDLPQFTDEEAALEVDTATGLLSGATLYLQGPNELRSRVLRVVGSGLGLGTSSAPGDAMNPSSGQTTLGDGDEDAFCALYDADEPLCGRYQLEGL